MRLGEIIEMRVKQIGMTKAEFGRRINTSRQNVNTLLRKEHFDTRVLTKICKVLNYDFYEHIKRPKHNPETGETEPHKRIYITIEARPEDHDKLMKLLKWSME